MLDFRAAKSYDDCTEVSDFCPVSATVLGYYPNMGANMFFAIAFAILTITSLVLGVWKRTWTYAATTTIGLLLETCGMFMLPSVYETGFG